MYQLPPRRMVPIYNPSPISSSQSFAVWGNGHSHQSSLLPVSQEKWLTRFLALFPYISAACRFPSRFRRSPHLSGVHMLLPHALLSRKRNEGHVLFPFFCLSKISQRLEVVSLLVVAMLFQCLGGKTEHWTMFFRFRSVSDHSIDPICGMVVSSKLLALLAFSFMVFKTPSTDTASSCSFQQS